MNKGQFRSVLKTVVAAVLFVTMVFNQMLSFSRFSRSFAGLEKDKLERGICDFDTKITVLELAERYIATKTGVKESTKAGYRTTLNTYTHLGLEDVQNEMVSRAHFASFVTNG